MRELVEAIGEDDLLDIIHEVLGTEVGTPHEERAEALRQSILAALLSAYKVYRLPQNPA